MTKIPKHKISEQFDGKSFSLSLITEVDTKRVEGFDYVHRDDYYIFFLMEKGKAKLAIDFEEYEVTDNNLLCVLPGQVHHTIENDAYGWFLIVDNVLVKDHFKKDLKKYSNKKNKLELNDNEFDELKMLVSSIHKRAGKNRAEIAHDLISAYIGTIIEIYQKEFPVYDNSRQATIASQFELLLLEHYNILKRPADYAKRLNISVPYLNECVKKNTGLPVSYHILNRIVLESKRMLYHSNKSVKEIAFELGYKDYAYFSRLFKKVTGVTASAFRNKNSD